VDAQAGGEAVAGPFAVVAAAAAALAAVAQAARGAVVARADDALLAHEDAADAALHAVGPLRGERRERHEVRIPTGPEAVLVEEVDLAERGVEVREVGRRVEEPDGGAGHYGEVA